MERVRLVNIVVMVARMQQPEAGEWEWEAPANRHSRRHTSTPDCAIITACEYQAATCRASIPNCWLAALPPTTPGRRRACNTRGDRFSFRLGFGFTIQLHHLRRCAHHRWYAASTHCNLSPGDISTSPSLIARSNKASSSSVSPMSLRDTIQVPKPSIGMRPLFMDQNSIWNLIPVSI